MTPSNGSRLQNGGSYSSIVGSIQAQNAPETVQQRSDNPFKYSKEGMIQVYQSMFGAGDKIKHVPLDFERYDAIASPSPVLPVNATEMTPAERALLAGKITSDPKPRREPTSTAGGDARAGLPGQQEAGRRGISDGKTGSSTSGMRVEHRDAGSARRTDFRRSEAAPESFSRRRFDEPDASGNRSGRRTVIARDPPASVTAGGQKASQNGPAESANPDLSAPLASEQTPSVGTEAHKREASTTAADAVPADTAPPLDGRASAALREAESALNLRTPSTERTKDAFTSLTSAGRSTSRLASLGMFDQTASRAGPSSSTSPKIASTATGLGAAGSSAAIAGSNDNTAGNWRDDKEDDVIKEVMGYATANRDDMSSLTSMYQNQSLEHPSSTTDRANLAQSRYVEQAYNPLGGLDLFSSHKSAFAAPAAAPSSSQNGTPGALAGAQASARNFMDAAASPGPLIDTSSRQESAALLGPRVMVMPDKLKWMYRDPTGQHQGPFSGLEMHDWYKAGFFQPNLLVKREEDDDFEPLSILIRRIGNQREPFLVPLPSQVAANSTAQVDARDAWSSQAHTPGTTASAAPWGSQPPFPQSFPSFGTTLTAEQQNALERRKQEEQYMMHRQREFLQQQQMAQQMAQQRLVHNSMNYNAFGSHGGGAYGNYGNLGASANNGFYPQFQRNQSPFGPGPQDRIGSVSQNLAPGQYDLEPQGGGGGFHGAWQQSGPQGSHGPRPQQQDFGMAIFDTPRSEMTELPARADIEGAAGADVRTASGSQMLSESQSTDSPDASSTRLDATNSTIPDASPAPTSTMASQSTALADLADDSTISIASPDMRASSAAVAGPTSSLQPQVLTGTVAETTQSSSMATPAPAPWATPAAAEARKGLSLKEIQDIEAKQNTERKARERKVMEAARAQQVAAAAAAALPVGDELGQAAVPLTWADAKAVDVAGAAAPWKAASGTTARKTFAQIQAEEERIAKAKLVAQQVAQSRTTATDNAGQSMNPLTSTGSRYADSVAKAAPQDSMWSTVGASGKAVVQAAQSARRGTAPKSAPSAPAASVAKAAPTTRSGLTTTKAIAGQPDPMAVSPEFYAWAKTALRDLDASVSFDDIFQLLLSFAPSAGKDTQDIISETIYSNSRTVDGRRFAEEFVRRRREDMKNKEGRNRNASELRGSTTDPVGDQSSGWSSIVKSGGKVPAAEPVDEWSNNIKVKAGGRKARK